MLTEILAENIVTIFLALAGVIGSCVTAYYSIRRGIEKVNELLAKLAEVSKHVDSIHDQVLICEERIKRNTKDIEEVRGKVFK